MTPALTHQPLVFAPGSLLVERIRQRMDALKLSPFSAAKKAGLGADFVRDLLREKVKSPSAYGIAKLAFALETNSEWLLGLDRFGADMMAPIFPANSPGALIFWCCGNTLLARSPWYEGEVSPMLAAHLHLLHLNGVVAAARAGDTALADHHKRFEAELRRAIQRRSDWRRSADGRLAA